MYLSNTCVPSVPEVIFTPPRAVSILLSREPIFKVPAFFKFTPIASLDITTIFAPVKVIGLGLLKSNSMAVAFPLKIISPSVKSM